MTLKLALEKDFIKEGLLTNAMFMTEEEMEKAVAVALESEEDNSISMDIERDGNIVSFVSSMYADVNKGLLLLDSSIIDRSENKLIGVYSVVFDNGFTEVEEEITDVWGYAEWRLV